MALNSMLYAVGAIRAVVMNNLVMFAILAILAALNITVLVSRARADDWQTLQDVQRRVNLGIAYNKGMASPAWAWRVWPKEGACGDYTKTKSAELLRAGFSQSRLMPIVCTTWNNQRHAYLLVDGRWALDNRFPNVVRYEDEDCK